MPLPIFIHSVVAHPAFIIQAACILVSLIVIKRITSGKKSILKTPLNGKVYLVSGGTNGIGLALVTQLAERGCQVVLLTRNKDGWLESMIEDLRASTGNDMIYAEECDFANLLSVRKFVSTWLNAKEPRKLDGINFCHSLFPGSGSRKGRFTEVANGQKGQPKNTTISDITITNFLSIMHFLTLMKPAIAAQPNYRSVRIVFHTCTLFHSTAKLIDLYSTPTSKNNEMFAASKRAMESIACSFQNQFKEKNPNVHFLLADPGISRTPSLRSWLTWGNPMGLIVWLLLYPLLWLVIKSAYDGSQTAVNILSEEFVVDATDGFYRNCTLIRRETKADEQLYNQGNKAITQIEDKIKQTEKAKRSEQKVQKQKDNRKRASERNKIEEVDEA